MRVLVVDDEPAFSEPLAERLALRGYETATAQDADAALAELARGPRDLIFLDVGLPGMDGVDLLKILREHHPQTDVVMLSGAGDMGKAVQAMNISHKGGVGHLLEWRFDRVVLSVHALSTIIIMQIKASLGKTRQGEQFFAPCGVAEEVSWRV